MTTISTGIKCVQPFINFKLDRINHTEKLLYRRVIISSYVQPHEVQLKIDKKVFTCQNQPIQISDPLVDSMIYFKRRHNESFEDSDLFGGITLKQYEYKLFDLPSALPLHLIKYGGIELDVYFSSFDLLFIDQYNEQDIFNKAQVEWTLSNKGPSTGKKQQGLFRSPLEVASHFSVCDYPYLLGKVEHDALNNQIIAPEAVPLYTLDDIVNWDDQTICKLTNDTNLCMAFSENINIPHKLNVLKLLGGLICLYKNN